jgi:hypothetical protein
MRKHVTLAFLLVLLCGPLAAQDYEITRWSVASGGTMEASGGDWILKGTIGQWEATEARELSGGQWQLTGGFWADVLEALGDFIFSDRFEEEST